MAEIKAALREAGKLKDKQDILNILRVPALRFTSDSNLRRQRDELEVIVNRWWPSIDDSAIEYVLAFVDSLPELKDEILDDENFYSSTYLAEHLHIPPNSRKAFRKRLERLRRSNDDCYIEITQHKPREAKFKYKAKYARLIAEGITNKRG